MFATSGRLPKRTSMLLPVEYVLTRMCIVGAAATQLPLFFVMVCAGRY
jgi:hypothetical protein